jgi:predicted alpha-1,6-mannanase (GH76 family)
MNLMRHQFRVKCVFAIQMPPKQLLCLDAMNNVIPRPMQMKFLCALSALLCAALSVRAFDLRDADAAFSAYNSHFYTVSNGLAYYQEDTGGGRPQFWVNAEQIEMIEDAWDRTHNTATHQMIEQSIAGFVNVHGTNWTWNEYNDDIVWMTIACERGYLATTNNFYRRLAKLNFDAVYARSYDHALGGGLWWTTNQTGKNACINGPAAISACLLCEICNDPSYLAKARAIYAWERGALFNPANGAVYDNMRLSGRIGHKTFTYNEGTFIGAADLLWKLTGDTNYLSDALLAANYTRDVLSPDGILPAYGSGDAAGFNAIFMRWLARFVDDRHLWPQFYDWMSANADAAWKVRRADNLSWQNWISPTPPGVLNSWNCSDTVVILQVVPSKQPEK